ncbi:hypothetical protein CCACVL1_07469 [Corchorus capsularis]|uniref:Uncharacterized protein n=1 Tax=Corchorus capsularis TaxID=210143 RepID=A0A1R3J5R4_COCAP|nr:hypothetical protein CCACVL1_07469 [Corchorus capsularis]
MASVELHIAMRGIVAGQGQGV